MEVNTLIIGFIPLLETTRKKPREIKEDRYFKELISGYNLGNVYYSSHSEWRDKVDQTNPVFIVVLNGEYFAKTVQDYKGNALLYTAYDYSDIGRRKAQSEERMEKNKAVFSEIELLVQKIREEGEGMLDGARAYAKMSDKDLYIMITTALTGKDEALKKKAWQLLMENGNKRLLWLRAELICNIWGYGDGKAKEEFLCMAMSQHIDNGMARKMEDFIDEEGQRFHQYMLCDYFGNDLNYIRRIPHGFKKQEKWGYVAILEKYKTPTGPQMLLEAGEGRSKKTEYFRRIEEEWKDDYLARLTI